MRTDIRAMLAGAPTAIAIELAHDMLAQAMPLASDVRPATAMAGGAERFTVQRGLAVVPVRGILTPNSAILEYWYGWTTYFGVIETMAELADRSDVSAIALDVGSPGGLVIECAGAAAAIAAAAKVKPVHAIASPMAASAAYWLASQAETVTVVPGAVVGSIGVACTASSVVGPSSWGEQLYNLTSSHARAKRPDPGTPEGLAELRRSLDEAEAEFHAAVSVGRNIPPADLAARLSVTDDPRDGGAVFSGADAVSRGLADTVETRAAFYDRMFTTYGAPVKSAASARFGAIAQAAMVRAGL